MDTAVKPQGCTNIKLRQLMRRVAQHYDAEVGKIGLKGTQYSLLSYVVKLGPIRPGDLAREMRIGASTLTRNLRPLIDAGLDALEAWQWIPGGWGSQHYVALAAELGVLVSGGSDDHGKRTTDGRMRLGAQPIPDEVLELLRERALALRRARSYTSR